MGTDICKILQIFFDPDLISSGVIIPGAETVVATMAGEQNRTLLPLSAGGLLLTECSLPLKMNLITVLDVTFHSGDYQLC